MGVNLIYTGKNEKENHEIYCMVVINVKKKEIKRKKKLKEN